MVKKRASNTPNPASLAETFLSQLASRRSFVEAALTLPAGEGERAISRSPIGRMAHRSITAFKTLGKELKPGAPGVVAMQDLPEAAQQLERQVGPGTEFLPASFLVLGASRQAAVARIRLTKPHEGLPAGAGWGTGFLVSPNLLMTNNHVIPDKAFAKGYLRVQFNFQNDIRGGILPVEEFDFDPDSFFHFSDEKKLDYTLIRLKPQTSGLAGAAPVLAGAKWGFVPMADNLDVAIGQQVNVIQHPDGRPKEVVLHQNEITKVFENVIHYKADTEPGSSGSPVFNNSWELVALHHAGGEQAASGEWLSNEGIRLDKIIADLRSRAAGIIPELGIT